MKTKKLAIFFLLACQFYGHGQGSFQTFYRNIYEYNSLGNFGATILQTHDSGFIMIGLNADTINAGSKDIYLIKTNHFGDTIWTKIYGTTSYDVAYKVIQTSDGGYAFCGVSDGNPILIKMNSSGDTLWTKQYLSTYSHAMAHALQQTSDGGFILAGEVSITFGNVDFMLMKTDLAGNLQWSRMFGGSGLERAYSVFEINSSGYILSGFSESFSFMSDEVYVVRTDLSGNLLWSKIYGGNGNDIPYCMAKVKDGGYVLAGLSTSFNGNNNQDIYVIRIDSSGNLIWSKDYNYGVFDYAYSISQTNDNGFIVSGGTDGAGYYPPYLLKINYSGDTMWSKTIDTNHIAYCAIQTNDNGFAILASKCDTTGCGLSLIKTDNLGNACLQKSIHPNIVANTTIENIPSTSSDTAFFETASMNIVLGARGNISQICPPISGIETLNNSYGIKIFPNPFSAQTIVYSDFLFKNATLIYYNTCGQIVKQIKDVSGQSVILHRENLPNGYYFVRLTQDSKLITTSKLVITE